MACGSTLPLGLKHPMEMTAIINTIKGIIMNKLC